MKLSRLVQRSVLVAGLGALLGLTFAAYLKPDMMVSLALQVWSCF